MIMNYTPKLNTVFTWWLRICCMMIVLMVLIGGVTRLTGSGLSIIEWKPITGVIPPLNLTDWLVEFDKYQTSPEFQQNNSDMSLKDFKFIYLLEYIHRLVGRITGLLFLLPLIFFSRNGQIKNKDIPVYGLISLLFAIQGFMGWYMVKSGLVNNPYVSPFRLANHLSLAMVIYSLLFWQLMKNNFNILLRDNKTNFGMIKNLCLVSIPMLLCQIYLGGIVAGLDAGLIYNSFPLMGDGLIPAELKEDVLNCGFFYNPVFVQFIHRIIAFLLTITICALVIQLFRTHYTRLRLVAITVLCALIFQITIGILTLLYLVPIVPALLHQIGAMVLLSSLLWCYYLVQNKI